MRVRLVAPIFGMPGLRALARSYYLAFPATVPLPYTIREGLAGFARAKFAAIASTAAMTVALVLIGLFAVVTLQTREVSSWLRQRVGEIEIFLVEDASETTAEALRERAATMPGVDETEYISHARAQAIFQQEFGEGGEIFYDEAFLPASIRVRVTSAYANADSLEAMRAEFMSWNRVDDVVFNQDLLARVQSNLQVVNQIGLVLGVLVLLASIFLVANTIRLTVYARRLLIRTMKLVGATDAFVQRPFLVEGIVQGVVAGLAAGLTVWAVYEVAARQVEQLTPFDALGGLSLVVALVAFGALLGWVGSYFAVRRFVRNVALH